MGLDGCPWYLLTIIVLWLYIIITILSCYNRPDFLNLTICVVSYFMISDPTEVKKWTFRLLVLAVFVSIIFDIIFFMLNDGDVRRI